MTDSPAGTREGPAREGETMTREFKVVPSLCEITFDKKQMHGENTYPSDSDKPNKVVQFELEEMQEITLFGMPVRVDPNLPHGLHAVLWTFPHEVDAALWTVTDVDREKGVVTVTGVKREP